MLGLLKIYLYYLQSFLHETFAFPINNIVLKHASESLHNRITYRFAISAPSDRLISVRIIKYILFNLFKSSNPNKYDKNTSVAIFDVSKQIKEKRLEYINRLSGEDVKLFLSREDLICGVPVIAKFLFATHLFIAAPFVVVLSLLKSDKMQVPYHFLCSLEALGMFILLKQHAITNLHFFCIYETDSNMLAYSLMNNGIKVNKIPSEVPLQFLNRTIVADSLSFCFRYQEEEYKAYESTMHVKRIQHWIPENSLSLEHLYISKERSTIENTVGFYSSGMWYRKEIDTMDLPNADEYERNLLSYLIEFIGENPSCKLIIFLHPIEKANIDRARQYYNSFSVPFEFADLNSANAHLFRNADVVVSLYSTLVFERIFWGFKTIMFPLGQTNFPVHGSVFNNVCALTKEHLTEKLDFALKTEAMDYYKIAGMTNYTYREYKCFNKVREKIA